MTDRRASLMEPRVEELLGHVDSKFTLVTLAARRAREINDYYNQLGEGLGRIVPPQVTSVSRKPLSIALEEVEAEKIVPREITEDEGEPLDAAEAAEAALATIGDDETADAEAGDTGDAGESETSGDEAG